MNQQLSGEALRRDQGQADKAGGLLSYVLPALFVVGFLLFLIAIQNRAEATAAGVAALLPVGYAFGAGMVASVNPCGFLLLPSYISYSLGTEEAGFYDTSSWERTARALLLGVVATGGFVLVFASVGAVITAGGQWLAAFFPHAGAAVGVAMVGLGLWLLITHRTMGLAVATRVAVAPRRNLLNVFLFGTAYAIGSLGCTLPIFLVVVGSALGSQSFGYALSQFIGYSLGMGTVLVAVTIGVALFRNAVARALRAALPHVHRTSALFLTGAGAYLIYYWVFFAGF